MRLSKFKISGFKSFVDPTTIEIPSNLVAVVGPNGCGKSNIIDAVTWVMGESSPKYLRGESLTDVIFNGSSARKPVGQASVELVFDNSDGTIGGEYAQYAEISVKRTINRESDSTYYLNGARCRKRDIAGIFLGTGIGPRSYSIIGQNMISRIIEAKPADMRAHLEEAAGISKYKERRRETELRINHTKDNLSRVNDLRGELEKQLGHLKHQASVAEKFKTLKQQERVLRAELYTMQWRELDSKMVDSTMQIQREETALEARNSELSGTEREVEQLRHEQRVANDGFQEVQRRYYAVGNEITRIEQDILHHQEREAQWQGDLKQTEDSWQEIKNELTEAEDNLRDLERELSGLEPRMETASSEVETTESALSDAENTMQTWQTQWDEFNKSTADTAQTVQVKKTHIQHLEERIQFLKKRHEELADEAGRFNFTQLNQELEDCSQQSYEVADMIDLQRKQLADATQELHVLQETQQTSNARLNDVRSDLQKLRGQQASLEALQQTALGQRDNPASPWLAEYALDSKTRLAQNIEVEKGWEVSVEKALGFCLQAVCVDDLADVTATLDGFTSGNLCVFSTKQNQAGKRGDKGALLLDKIKSSLPLDSLLSGIYVADTLADALSLCERLDANESVITRDGTWANRSWLKMLRQEDPAAGVFQREQELKDLSARIEQTLAVQEELEQHIAQHTERLKELEISRDELQQTYNQQQAQSAQINAQQKMKQERLNELKAQSEKHLKDIADCTNQINDAQAELAKAQTVLDEATLKLEGQTASREQLLEERENHRENVSSSRTRVNSKRQEMHEIEIRLQTAKSQKSSSQQAIGRLQHQMSALNERKITLQGELSSMPPMDSLKQTLSRTLDKHVSIESELNKARISVESLEQEFKNLEDKRHIIEKDAIRIRGSLETLRVSLQGWKVKSDTILESMKDTEYTLEDTLKELPQDISVEEWDAKLEQTVNRINRLGAINLVAIEEYSTCLERKQYLDRQVEDLQAGLSTLEDAIAKIDKETRAKFKDTFDKVNNRFQELFPTVFGGGKAYLELEGDNLLEAGVTVMACPPGKRNSSIHLLSGGEKSLTAIALVFSIFYLNPAPFCMLDEVDAALDDANVVRFTRLVKAMTENTQFIFISHNKITIEMGEHLIGVTMNEPGVSRLVSVDIESAMKMADA